MVTITPEILKETPRDGHYNPWNSKENKITFPTNIGDQSRKNIKKRVAYLSGFVSTLFVLFQGMIRVSQTRVRNQRSSLLLWGSKVPGSILRTDNLIDMLGEFFSNFCANAGMKLSLYLSPSGRFQITICDQLNIHHQTSWSIETVLDIVITKTDTFRVFDIQRTSHRDIFL